MNTSNDRPASKSVTGDRIVTENKAQDVNHNVQREVPYCFKQEKVSVSTKMRQFSRKTVCDGEVKFERIEKKEAFDKRSGQYATKSETFRRFIKSKVSQPLLTETRQRFL